MVRQRYKRRQYKEFEAEISKLNTSSVQQLMSGEGCDLFEFKMNPSHASNLGSA